MAPPDAPVPGKRGPLNRSVVTKLLVVAVAMFGFGYAMVPLYKKFCAVTNLNVLTQEDPNAERLARNTQVDMSRTVTVEFDSNARGPLSFKPETAHLEVHPGELTTVLYSIRNNADYGMQAQAIPSYAPQQAGPYFHKLECFCFKQQHLEAHQEERYPVVFFVDPKLPKNVQTITLSYTFFQVGNVGRADLGPAVPLAHG